MVVLKKKSLSLSESPVNISSDLTGSVAKGIGRWIDLSSTGPTGKAEGGDRAEPRG